MDLWLKLFARTTPLLLPKHSLDLPTLLSSARLVADTSKAALRLDTILVESGQIASRMLERHPGRNVGLGAVLVKFSDTTGRILEGGPELLVSKTLFGVDSLVQ